MRSTASPARCSMSTAGCSPTTRSSPAPNSIAELAPHLYGRDPERTRPGSRARRHQPGGRAAYRCRRCPRAGLHHRRGPHRRSHHRPASSKRSPPDPAPLSTRIRSPLRSTSASRTSVIGSRTGSDGWSSRSVEAARRCSVVIGVAGSGKTTALDTVTALLERSGYRVLGTSTSGQAARTLATEAHLDATTFASLLWRLDHGHVTLDPRHRRDRRRDRHGRRRQPRPPCARRPTRPRVARARR